MKSNHVLTSLYLDQNKINDKGLYALAEVLRINNKTLKELNIMYNAFGEGIEQLKTHKNRIQHYKTYLKVILFWSTHNNIYIDINVSEISNHIYILHITFFS